MSRRDDKTPLPPDVLADALHDASPPTGRLLKATPVTRGSEHAVLLRNLDFAAAEFDGHPALYEDSAAAIRKLEAEVERMVALDLACQEQHARMEKEIERLTAVERAADELIAHLTDDRDRIAAELQALREANEKLRSDVRALAESPPMASLSFCCGMVRRGRWDESAMHDGGCRGRNGGALGKTYYLHDVSALLTGEPTSQSILDGWRPIESAPRDGTEVLLWGAPQFSSMPGTELYFLCVWNALHEEWITDNDQWIRGATHWQPLPAPPTREAG